MEKRPPSLGEDDLPHGIAPSFGPTVRSDDPPPPLSGGTLALSEAEGVAVAADPDRDLVYIVDLAQRTLRATIPLAHHDEPGRVVFDRSGRAHVVLRRAGQVVSIDIAAGTLLARRDVCAEPRGLAFDAAADAILVACVGGELVTLPTAGGPPYSTRFVRDDLRDVVVTPKGIVVSTFRTGELLRLDADGNVVSNGSPRRIGRTARVSWRMIAANEDPSADDDGVITVGEDAPSEGAPLPPSSGYGSGGSCESAGPMPLVRAPQGAFALPAAVLPVDIARSDRQLAVVAAGNGHTPQLPQVVLVDRAETTPCPRVSPVYLPGEITSVGFARRGATMLALSRQPALLFFVTEAGRDSLVLSTVSREDTGHAVFHSSSGQGVACASCHPDGRDDGGSWRTPGTLAQVRRTPSLVGTVGATEPYHWDGSLKDMNELVHRTFVGLMGGPALRASETAALDGWLGGLAPLRGSASLDAETVARGAVLFASSDAKCSSCHTGVMRTNNANVDVGTGGAFQVPSLVNVSFRAPFFHDGREATLEVLVARGHGGNTLSPSQAADVAAFLRTM